MNRFQQIKAELAEALEPGQQRDELQRQKKTLLPQKLLKGEQDPGNLDIDLESVATDLREYRDKLKTFLNSNLQAEIAQSLQNAGKTVSLVEKLKQDTNTALSESRDLETLAEHLQSRKIARVADTEEERIKELGRKLQRIDQRSQRVETLASRLQQMMDDSGIELENLNQEIEKRVTAVNLILGGSGEEGEEGSGKKDSEKNEKADRFARILLEEEEKLINAGNRGKENLTRDIQYLQYLYRYRKFEEGKLEKIESRLRSGDLEKAEEASEELAEENIQVENRTGSSPESLEEELEKEIEISKALYRFFSRVRKLRENGVKPEALFEAMARNSSIDKERALKLFRGLKQDYTDVHEGITKAAKLAQREHKIEKHEYDQIRKIEDESNALWKEANSEQKKHLKELHANLRTIGFDLDEIEPSSGSSSGGASSADSLKGPGKGEEWIVAISDIHGQFDMAMDTLQALDHAGYKPIVQKASDGQWEKTNSNYRLVLNGDMMDRGPENKRCTRWAINLCRRDDVEYLIGNHETLILSNLIPRFWASGMKPGSEIKGEFLDELSEGNIKGVFKGDDYLYLHAGQDFSDPMYDGINEEEIITEINSAVRKWKDVDSSQYKIDNPDEFITDSDKEEFWQQRAWCMDGRSGGRGPKAGITWRDWKHGVSSGQIVGHTKGTKPRYKNGSLNVNTIRENIKKNSIEPGRSISIETPDELFTLTRADGDILPKDFGEERIKYRKY